jgi:NADPH:quinone reductase-like Zn-dependent oxidoreductase
MFGLRKPKFTIFGAEFSGTVEAIGKDVTRFKPGDQVLGLSPDFGAHAEYICLSDNKAMIAKSAKMTHEEAVAMVDGGLTSLTFLRDVAKIQPGQKVLINGASGAVGASAVQLAKHFGAEVTGVCSAANVDLVKSLGADHVIDYTKTDFTKNGKTYDIIFDAVGKRSFSQCKRALTAKGVYLTTVPTFGIVADMLGNVLRSKKAKFVPSGLMQQQDNLVFLRGLFEAGKLKAVIDRRYPLQQIAEGYRYVETGRKKGNVVISVAPSIS